MLMRRREFIARLSVAGVYAEVPRLAGAEQGVAMRRVVVRVAGDETRGTTSLATFRNELAKLDWVEGRNLRIDLRNLLARHGWRKLMPRLHHPQRDLVAQRDFKKTAFHAL
jgi:winged helix-turn-helix protein